jgi:hypothetical protein
MTDKNPRGPMLPPTGATPGNVNPPPAPSAVSSGGGGQAVSGAGKPRNLGDMLREFAQHQQTMRTELAKVIVGQHDVIEQLLAAIFTRGHCLLEGVPGLAKTLMVSTLADILDVPFKRIQFTPDLMPSDITGTQVLEEDEAGRRSFRFVEGPIFTSVLLADEINRTPPKTQAALLEAMDLSAARSPARPVYVQHQGRLSVRRRRRTNFDSDDARRIRAAQQGAYRTRDSQRAATRSKRCRQPVCDSVRIETGSRHEAFGRISTGVHQAARRLGSRAPRRPESYRRWKSTGRDGWPVRRRPQ